MSMLTAGAMKIFTDFPHHNCLRPFIFRLRIAYERPQDPGPRMYAVHHFDRGSHGSYTERGRDQDTIQNVNV